MHEVLVGVPMDLFGSRTAVYDIFVRRDRLRGLGALLCLLSLTWFVIAS